ncbi:MAG: Xaa-Pro aminopeptidase [Solirubrobacteraceae bacterium]|nr:Xaa-Pro aminopeptidase [Solirubrobacteraceae bacterium]
MNRADRVSERLGAEQVDLLLVTNLVNVRYLTGFTGSNGLAIVGPDVRRFLTDFRYVEQASAQVSDFDREQAPQDFLTALSDGWPEGELRAGFEEDHVTVRAHRRLREIVPERIELVPVGGVVEAERAVKEPEEVERIRAAAVLVDAVYDWLFERGLVGRTEDSVAVALEHHMRELGATAPSFPSIVASGPRGALPHAVPSHAEIAPNTLVTLDLGVELDGYCSDCTRTWATGELPDDLAEAYAVTLEAQIAALDAVRPGPEGREIDAVARAVIGAAGHGDHFGHGLGHGVGLEVHEAPRLARSGEAALVAGNVVTVEPGIYLPGRGGVRIEDLAVVTDGGRDVLSATPKALRVVS